ncbi:unnamed protein product [Trichobilharzia regenti]|nr:unnamed protein product [Trichobilharzia regenti]
MAAVGITLEIVRIDVVITADDVIDVSFILMVTAACVTIVRDMRKVSISTVIDDVL